MKEKNRERVQRESAGVRGCDHKKGQRGRLTVLERNTNLFCHKQQFMLSSWGCCFNLLFNYFLKTHVPGL